MTRWHSRKAFFKTKLHRIVEFLVWQGITTAGNLLYGFLCVRLLPIGGYAKFAVVFAVLGSVVLLMDVGISNTLVPLVGERIDDLQLIADYMASLRHVAHRLFLLVAPVTALVFPLIVRKQGWPGITVGAMVATILFAAWFARICAAYGAVLILRRDRKRWYLEQMRASLGTLAVLLVFWALHWLNASSAILINVAGIVYMGQAYFFRARHLFKAHGHPSKRMRQEIVHLALPNSTSTIFYALQGQISLLIITMFGRTVAVASVGALTRLSQVFMLASQMNSLLVEPYFARLPRSRLKINYVIALVAAGACGAGCVLLAWFFPEVFLWILGPKYSHLRHEVQLVVVARSLGFIIGIMWTIHSARKFVYWWTNMALIVVTIVVQAFFIWKLDLSTVSAVLMLNVATCVAALAVHIASGIYGFVRGPRQLQDAKVSSPEAAHA
jgi:O-antigen/teichoic acid export membrane protein